jgi:hypothetical protein
MASGALFAFDVPGEARGFGIIADGHILQEEEPRIRDARLLAEAHDFNALMHCAASIHRSRVIDASDLEGNGMLTSVWRIMQGTTDELNLNPWKETDRWIAQARRLEQEAAAFSRHLRPATVPSISPGNGGLSDSRPRASKRKREATVVTSHYWCPTSSPRPAPEAATSSRVDDLSQTPRQSRLLRSSPFLNLQPRLGCEAETTATAQPTTATKSPAVKKLSPEKKLGSNSPYFASGLPSPTQNRKAKRPLPGTIPCIPFPPLTSASFGLVQERFAREPFWLLVAITFLIRTKGAAAVPVFLTLKDKFPTPEAIADAANSQEILDLIRHLGLAKNRLGILQKYAQLFIGKPPRAGTVYRVRNYDSRDVDISLVNIMTSPATNLESPKAMPETEDQDHPEAWEIGHMTQGKYAVDSWRIFCRDELLGRAEDWTGTGRGPEFQPEWMRVMPDDKELRAYLRWMWMGEGWEWDPLTGEKKPLREEMQRAVNEGRVEYDDGGGLRIIPGGVAAVPHSSET